MESNIDELIGQYTEEMQRRYEDAVGYGQRSERDGGYDEWGEVKGQQILLDSVNPTGSIMTEYTPELRANAKLADNITTLSETMGRNGDEYITIYRGTILKQKEINPWDFITTNPQLAKDYAGNGHVISKRVKLKDILDDRDDPLGEEYIYRPEGNALPTNESGVSEWEDTVSYKSKESVGISGAETKKESVSEKKNQPTGYMSVFDGTEKILRDLTEEEKEFVKNYQKIVQWESEQEIIARWEIADGVFAEILFTPTTDQKIKNRHKNYKIENLIISIHDANKILKWKIGKHTRINYIKFLDNDNFLLTSVDEGKNGNYTVTHFPVVENPKEYLKNLEKNFVDIKKISNLNGYTDGRLTPFGVEDYTNSIPNNEGNASENYKSTGGNTGISTAESRWNGEKTDFKLSERIKAVIAKLNTNYTRYVAKGSVGTFYGKTNNIALRSINLSTGSVFI